MINLNLKNQEVRALSPCSPIIRSQLIHIPSLWYEEKKYAYSQGGYNYYVRKSPENGQKEIIKGMYQAFWSLKSKEVWNCECVCLTYREEEGQERQERDGQEREQKGKYLSRSVIKGEYPSMITPRVDFMDNLKRTIIHSAQ